MSLRSISSPGKCLTSPKLLHLEADRQACPFRVPDLSLRSPLTVSGRYEGKFPDSLKVRGTLADSGDFIIDLKAQQAKDIPLDKVSIRKEINLLTAQAWFSQSKELEEKVVKMSIQTGVPSEYTCMIIVQNERQKQGTQSIDRQEVPYKIDVQKLVDSNGHKIILLTGFSVGFGNLVATMENAPPRFRKSQSADFAGEVFVKAASSCCGKLIQCCDCCCCMCIIKVCSKMNDQFAIACTQLCATLSCLACAWCCSDN